jgi:hypothetical protein
VLRPPVEPTLHFHRSYFAREGQELAEGTPCQ